MNKSRVWIDHNGDKFWFDSKRDMHNEEGPAWENTTGAKTYCIHGKMHREDGPAFSTGTINSELMDFRINGKQIL